MNRQELMSQIQKNVHNCKKCKLYEQANKAVPGEGNINSKLIFIGEAPGANEDATGRPFVGRAGKLLEQLLAKIGYQRSDIWIGNIIKHRPPQNRDPFPDEITACAPYLTMQLKAINPLLIVTLGRFALNYFYSEGKISIDKGRLIKLENYNVYPVYHPAAGLRNPKMLNALKDDFMRIPEVIKQLESGPILIALMRPRLRVLMDNLGCSDTLD